MKRLIKRLALYPNVIERPLCEAIVHGEKMVFEVISKRGNFVRIRNDRKIEVIHIDEISDLKVLD